MTLIRSARPNGSNAREGIFCFWTRRGAFSPRAAPNGSNAREGIFCFWTHRLPHLCSLGGVGSNAREGIFCFWTDAIAMLSDDIGIVLMPARAFFVFGL